MNGISRFISFVIGLIVLILLFVLIANRFNANRAKTTASNTVVTGTVTPTVTPAKKGFDLFGIFRKSTPTPTPTMTFAQQMQGVQSDQMGNPVNGQAAVAGSATQIPKTGAETLFFPIASAVFAAGMWLRKRA